MGGKSVLSCLILAVEAAGQDILTIEGLAKWQDGAWKLHPLQQAFIDEDAVQCGACIPGAIMTAKALLDANPNPTQQQVMEGLSGVLCRCIGYWPFVNATMAAAAKLKGG